MQLLSLLAPLPLLAAAHSPAPYNPFFPPKHTPNGILVSRDQLTSRAELEAAGREALVMSPMKVGGQAVVQPLTFEARVSASDIGHGLGKRGKGKGKRGMVRKIRRRATACTPPSSTTSSAELGVGVAEPTSSSEVIASPSITTRTATSPITTGIVPVVTSSSTIPVSSATTLSVIPTNTSTTTTQTTKHHRTATTTTHSSTTTTASTTTSSRTSTSTSADYTVDPDGNGPFSGWGTWFEDGLGACGWTNNANDPIVAISAQVFDNWPTWNGLNPNENPICGQHLEITWGGKSLVVKVADRCPGCDIRSLDMSAGAFEHFATLDVGLLGMDSYTGNITWSWVEGSGA